LIAYGTLAAGENINASHVSRVLRLTLLAPKIVETILDGRQPAEMTLVVEFRHLVPCFRLWAGKMPELAMCASADQCPLLSNSVQNIAPQRMQRCAIRDQRTCSNQLKKKDRQIAAVSPKSYQVF